MTVTESAAPALTSETQAALARSQTYRLLSTAYLYPGESIYAQFVEWSGSHMVVETLPVSYFASGGCLAALRAALDQTDVEALQAEHRRVFGPIISNECPPYETQYGSIHIFQQSQDLADIAGFYRAFGLDVSDRSRERVDYIGLELEFMSFLAYKQAYALTYHGADKADICMDAQRKFLQDHLGRWAPLFAMLLQRKAESGFYHALAALTAAFLAFEAARLGVEPQPLSEADFRPVTFEPECACFACGIVEKQRVGDVREHQL
jgi:DMSO reductase family type II enzyme chaperone